MPYIIVILLLYICKYLIKNTRVKKTKIYNNFERLTMGESITNFKKVPSSIGNEKS